MDNEALSLTLLPSEAASMYVIESLSGPPLVLLPPEAASVHCNRLLSYPIIAAHISKINNEPAQS